MEHISGQILGIAGPSGSGKNYLINTLTHTYPDTFTYIPSATTKPDDGSEDYCFVSEEKYADLKNDDDLVNNEQIVGFSYGYIKSFTANVLLSNRTGIITPYPPVTGKVFGDFTKFFDVKTFCIYLKPDWQTLELLRTRMEKRGREDSVRIEAKLKDAERQIKEFDRFKHAFDVVFPISNDINPVINWIRDYVLKV